MTPLPRVIFIPSVMLPPRVIVIPSVTTLPVIAIIGWLVSSINSAYPWGYNGRPAAATAKYGSQGYHEGPGTASANNGSQGGAWSKTCDWKQQSFSNKGKNADENGNKWRSGKGWQGIGESSWGHNRREPGISRPSYYNGSNYSANVAHGGASKDPETDWGQKQFGQYGRPRGGFAEGREDMAGVCRKREGPGGQDVPGYKGPRLQYVNQTTRRWNNGRQ